MLREPRPAPSLFTTRWAMAYLRGPLDPDQIASLMADRKATAPPAEQAPTAEVPASPSADIADATGAAAKSAAAAPGPTGAPPPADDRRLRRRTRTRGPAERRRQRRGARRPGGRRRPRALARSAAPWAAQASAPPATRSPALVARVALLFDDDKLDLRHTEEYEAVLYPLGATVDPAAAVAVDHDDCTATPAGATYRVTDVPLGSKTWFRDADKALVDHLYRSRTTQVLRNPALKLAARAGESAEEFAARCQAAADEGADQAQVKLQQRYEARIAKARTALDSAADRVEQAQAAQQTRRSSEIVEGAGSLLGAVLGGRRSARTMAATWGVLTGRSRSGEASQRVETARNRVADHQQALADLEADLARSSPPSTTSGGRRPPRSRTSTSRSRRATSG